MVRRAVFLGLFVVKRPRKIDRGIVSLIRIFCFSWELFCFSFYLRVSRWTILSLAKQYYCSLNNTISWITGQFNCSFWRFPTFLLRGFCAIATVRKTYFLFDNSWIELKEFVSLLSFENFHLLKWTCSNFAILFIFNESLFFLNNLVCCKLMYVKVCI